MTKEQTQQRALPEYSYEIRQEGNLLNLRISCKACEGPSGLLQPQCLAVVLNILSTEHYTDMITFSGTVQRQYTGDSIEYLKRLVDLSKLLQHLSSRSPLPFSAGGVFPEGQVDEVIAELEQLAESHGAVAGPLLSVEGGVGRIPGDAADRLAKHLHAQKAAVQRHLKRLDCPRCPYNPHTMFPRMSDLLMSNLKQFVDEVKNRTIVLGQGQPDSGCQRCLTLTVADLQFISDSMVEMANYVMARGGKGEEAKR